MRVGMLRLASAAFVCRMGGDTPAQLSEDLVVGVLLGRAIQPHATHITVSEGWKLVHPMRLSAPLGLPKP